MTDEEHLSVQSCQILQGKCEIRQVCKQQSLSIAASLECISRRLQRNRNGSGSQCARSRSLASQRSSEIQLAFTHCSRTGCVYAHAFRVAGPPTLRDDPEEFNKICFNATCSVVEIERLVEYTVMCKLVAADPNE